MSRISRLTGIAIGALVCASCASTPPAARTTPSVNVTGNWQGEWTCDLEPARPGVVVLALTQGGAAVKGNATVTNSAVNRNGNLEGSVSGDQFSIIAPDFSVNMKVTGNTMAGTFKGICTGKMVLNREPFQGTVQRNRLATIAANVEAIDLDKRVVTLRGPQGNYRTLQVDHRVQNLSDLSVGDQVNVAYYESWALNLGKPGDPAGAIVRSSPTSQVPGDYSARTVTIPATVEAIDGGRPSVTFKGPQGRSVEVVVDDPKILGRLKVGETYDIVYTEALAVRMDKGSKR